MNILYVKTINADELKIGEFYNSVKDKIVGVNKTQSLLHEYFSKYGSLQSEDFDQIPFTSKQKYSLVTAKVGSAYQTLLFGAHTSISNKISENVQDEVDKYVEEEEKKGNRVLIGAFFEGEKSDLNIESLKKSDKIIIFTIEEELNPGITDILQDLKNQGIAIKIISGDSLNSVLRILQKIGIDNSDAVDLSANERDLNELALSKTVFTRATPEDKLKIIQALQRNDFKVAMTGDGINDVLSIKAADVSISMEHASKIARDTADIVLLNNDFLSSDDFL